MDSKQRAEYAKRILDDPVVQEALAELERRAIEEFILTSRWWWGDRRRRIAAEHIREVRDFRKRLELAIAQKPIERMRTIA